MPGDGKCPECGLDVVQTTRRGWLLRAPIEARRRIRLGLALAAVAPAGMIVGVAFFNVAWAPGVPWSRTAAQTPWVIELLCAVAAAAALMGSGLAFCLGVWLTARGALMTETSDDSRPIFAATQLLGEVFGIAFVVTALPWTGTIVMWQRQSRVADQYQEIAFILSVLSIVLFMITAVLYAVALGHLSEAAPDRMLAKEARSLALWSTFMLTLGMLMCFSGGFMWAIVNARVSMRLRKAIRRLSLPENPTHPSKI